MLRALYGLNGCHEQRLTASDLECDELHRGNPYLRKQPHDPALDLAGLHPLPADLDLRVAPADE
ncbi:hypothetical protein LTR49_028717, partial [Elasticomyces elasticus]